MCKNTTFTLKIIPDTHLFYFTDHVHQWPLYDPVYRHYELLVEEVILYDHDMPDGGTTKA
jgi:hypothetical protein